MIKFERTQTIGAIAVGLIYAFATGNLVACIIPTILILLFISYKTKPEAK